MARGWESKAVEDQQQEAQAPKSAAPAVDPAQAARAAERATLQLARTRALADPAAGVRARVPVDARARDPVARRAHREARDVGATFRRPYETAP